MKIMDVNLGTFGLIQQIGGGMMKNPCKECIIKMMCKEPCEPAQNYIGDKIKKFKPRGSPGISNGNFLYSQCLKILEDPNSILYVGLGFPNGNRSCLIHVKDYNIILIEEAP